MGDNKRTLMIVVGIGLFLVGAIYGAVKLGGGGMLTDEEAVAQAKELGDDLSLTDKNEQEEREKLIRRIPAISKKSKDGRLPAAGRKAIWKIYKKLTPAQQIEMLKVLLPQEFSSEISKFYEKHQTPEARKTAVKKMVKDMQGQFDALSDEQLWEQRSKMDSGETKVYVKLLQRYYADSMSSDQRSDFEPVAREYLRQYAVVLQARKPVRK